MEERIMNYIQDMTIAKAEKECQELHSKFLSSYTNINTDPSNWSILEVTKFELKKFFVI